MDAHFAACGGCRGGAGGGREALALCGLGYDVDAYDCNGEARSVRYATPVRSRLPDPGDPCEPDSCPLLSGQYDGAVIGWVAYSHIQGFTQRTRFLRDLRRPSDRAHHSWFRSTTGCRANGDSELPRPRPIC